MSQFTRRSFNRLMALGAAGVTLGEFGPMRLARADDQFTIAMSPGSWGDLVTQSMVTGTGFEAAAGLKVAYEQDLDSVLQAKSLATCGDPAFTLWNGITANATVMAQRSCVDDYNLDVVTNYKDIYPFAVAKPQGPLEHWFAPWVIIVIGLVWNTKLATKPTSFNDMLNPQYKGKIAIPGYSFVGSTWLHGLNKFLGGDEDNVDPAMQFLGEAVRKNDAVIIDTTDQAMNLFSREEIVMAPFYNGRAAQLQEQGTPVALEYVPGTIQWGSGFTVMHGTKFPDAAQKMVNISLSPEVQLQWSKALRYPPSNMTAKLTPDLEKYQIPPGADKNFVTLDYAKIASHMSEYLDRWNREVIGA